MESMIFIGLRTEDGSIGFWLLVEVLNFDIVDEMKDTETEWDSELESKRVGGGMVSLGRTLGERLENLEKTFRLFPPQVIIKKKQKQRKGGNHLTLKIANRFT